MCSVTIQSMHSVPLLCFNLVFQFTAPLFRSKYSAQSIVQVYFSHYDVKTQWHVRHSLVFFPSSYHIQLYIDILFE